MHYILDTHILIWWLYDDKRLSAKYKNIIENPKNFIYISIASLWEIEIKRNLNKIEIYEKYIDIIKELDFNILNINIEHIKYLSKLANIHKDPFDRILISQAIVEDFILLTNDKKIEAYFK